MKIQEINKNLAVFKLFVELNEKLKEAFYLDSDTIYVNEKLIHELFEKDSLKIDDDTSDAYEVINPYNGKKTYIKEYLNKQNWLWEN